jgi:flagellar basal body rod protein FlgB
MVGQKSKTPAQGRRFDVDMDRERTQFADNSLKYQMGLTVLGGIIMPITQLTQGCLS